MFPGAKTWLLGNYFNLKEYERARMTDEIVENILKWLLVNIRRFADKKDEVQVWNPMTLIYLPGKVKMVVSDPRVLQALDEDKTLVDKNKFSYLGIMVFNKRFRNNVMSLTRSSEQVQRRRALTNGLTGRSHFNLLDGILNKVIT